MGPLLHEMSSKWSIAVLFSDLKNRWPFWSGGSLGTDPPVRALLWNEELMRGIVASLFNTDWNTWVSSFEIGDRIDAGVRIQAVILFVSLRGRRPLLIVVILAALALTFCSHGVFAIGYESGTPVDFCRDTDLHGSGLLQFNRRWSYSGTGRKAQSGEPLGSGWWGALPRPKSSAWKSAVGHHLASLMKP